MAVNGCVKGKRGERLAVKACIAEWNANPDKVHGCRRAQQFDGAYSGDILHGLPGFHIEVKYRSGVPGMKKLYAEAAAAKKWCHTSIGGFAVCTMRNVLQMGGIQLDHAVSKAMQDFCQQASEDTQLMLSDSKDWLVMVWDTDRAVKQKDWLILVPKDATMRLCGKIVAAKERKWP